MSVHGTRNLYGKHELTGVCKYLQNFRTIFPHILPDHGGNLLRISSSFRHRIMANQEAKSAISQKLEIYGNVNIAAGCIRDWDGIGFGLAILTFLPRSPAFACFPLSTQTTLGALYSFTRQPISSCHKTVSNDNVYNQLLLRCNQRSSGKK